MVITRLKGAILHGSQYSKIEPGMIATNRPKNGADMMFAAHCRSIEYQGCESLHPPQGGSAARAGVSQANLGQCQLAASARPLPPAPGHCSHSHCCRHC